MSARRRSRMLIVALVAVLALVLGLPLLSLTIRSARAAAILDMGGQKLVVLTAEEFVRLVEGKDAEIARLQEKLDTRRRVECPVI